MDTQYLMKTRKSRFSSPTSAVSNAMESTGSTLTTSQPQNGRKDTTKEPTSNGAFKETEGTYNGPSKVTEEMPNETKESIENSASASTAGQSQDAGSHITPESTRDDACKRSKGTAEELEEFTESTTPGMTMNQPKDADKDTVTRSSFNGLSKEDGDTSNVASEGNGDTRSEPKEYTENTVFASSAHREQDVQEGTATNSSSNEASQKEPESSNQVGDFTDAHADASTTNRPHTVDEDNAPQSSSNLVSNESEDSSNQRKVSTDTPAEALTTDKSLNVHVDVTTRFSSNRASKEKKDTSNEPAESIRTAVNATAESTSNPSLSLEESRHSMDPPVFDPLSTFEEAYSACLAHARKAGYGIRLRGRKRDANGELSSASVVCDRCSPTNYYTPVRPRKTKHCDCPFQYNLLQLNSTKWYVVPITSRHNHEPFTDPRNHPCFRHLTDRQKAWIEAMSDEGRSAKDILYAIHTDDPASLVTLEDVRNHLYRILKDQTRVRYAQIALPPVPSGRLRASPREVLSGLRDLEGDMANQACYYFGKFTASTLRSACVAVGIMFLQDSFFDNKRGYAFLLSELKRLVFDVQALALLYKLIVQFSPQCHSLLLACTSQKEDVSTIEKDAEVESTQEVEHGGGEQDTEAIQERQENIGECSVDDAQDHTEETQVQDVDNTDGNEEATDMHVDEESEVDDGEEEREVTSGLDAVSTPTTEYNEQRPDSDGNDVCSMAEEHVESTIEITSPTGGTSGTNDEKGDGSMTLDNMIKAAKATEAACLALTELRGKQTKASETQDAEATARDSVHSLLASLKFNFNQFSTAA